MSKVITLADYFDHLVQRGLHQATIQAQRSSILRFITWMGKKEPHLLEDDKISVLQKVFQKHIQLFKKTAGKEMNCKAGTINLTIRHLKQCLAWLLEHKLIPDNPAEEMKYIPEDRLKTKWITEQQERKLFAELRLLLGNPKQYRKVIREYAMIAMMYFTGIRVEELCHLTLTNIQMNERSGWMYIYGKENKQRKVDLNKSIRKILSQYLDEYKERLKGPYLFDSQRSEQVTTRAVQHVVEKYASRLHMPNLTCHALRHTCLHNLVKAGVPLPTVAEIAGHIKADGTPNIEMTLRYVKPSEEEKANAMEIISWD
jgi:integrase/recombinase XerC/integrase/recombinase XerD